MNGLASWIVEKFLKYMDGLMDESYAWMSWMDKWMMNQWMDGWMEGWMDGWTFKRWVNGFIRKMVRGV
jgi:hypothetical protein